MEVGQLNTSLATDAGEILRRAIQGIRTQYEQWEIEVKYVLKLEELLMVVLSIFLFSKLGYAWWWYPLLFFTPDLSMLGYIGGTRLGAFTYNVIHHKALSIGILLVGAVLGNQPLQLAGLILFGHSSMDRVLGYGLKYEDAFRHTHLSTIGGSGQRA